MTIIISVRNVYGNLLTYPACQTSRKFADLLNVKSFNHKQLCRIEALGYTIINERDKVNYSAN